MYAKLIGVGSETLALIEGRRTSPLQTEDDIIKSELSRAGAIEVAPSIGCDLGKGAILYEGEPIYLFRYKHSKDAGKPEAVALATGGKLVLDGSPVGRSRGSLVAPALASVQARLGDRNDKGKLTSLDAWDYWHVRRNGSYMPVGELRNASQIVRRGRAKPLGIKLDLTKLGLRTSR